jgi:hypothetical protein
MNRPRAVSHRRAVPYVSPQCACTRAPPSACSLRRQSRTLLVLARHRRRQVGEECGERHRLTVLTSVGVDVSGVTPQRRTAEETTAVTLTRGVDRRHAAVQR